MAQPTEEQDWYSRFVESYGPSFRIDISNPELGEGGAEVYSMYGFTASNEKSSISFDHNGKLKLHSDLTIEIVAGEKNSPQDEEILIHSRNGNITIKADKNGAIKISGKNITIEADYDLELSAGNDIKMRAGNQIIRSSTVDNFFALKGNAIPTDLDWLGRVWNGTDGNGTEEGPTPVPIGLDVLGVEFIHTVAKKVNPF